MLDLRMTIDGRVSCRGAWTMDEDLALEREALDRVIDVRGAEEVFILVTFIFRAIAIWQRVIEELEDTI